MRARTIPLPHGAVTLTELTLPASWAQYFINGDKTLIDTLDMDDRRALRNTEAFGSCISCSDAEFFTWRHDASADGVLPGMCLVFTFVQQHDEPPYQDLRQAEEATT